MPATIALVLWAGFSAAEAPECSVTVAESDGAVEVVYRVAWAGAADDWRVAPPQIPAVEGLRWSHGRAVASANADESAVEFWTNVTGDPGEYALPPVSIDIAGSSESLTIESESVDVEIAAAAPEANPMVFGAAIAALLLGAFAIFIFNRKNASGHVIAADGDASELEEEDLLAIASKRRIEGDAYGFYRTLAEAARSDAGLVERLQRSSEDAGFRGVEFTADQMDQDYRAVERIVASRDKENDE